MKPMSSYFRGYLMPWLEAFYGQLADKLKRRCSDVLMGDIGFRPCILMRTELPPILKFEVCLGTPPLWQREGWG